MTLLREEDYGVRKVIINLPSTKVRILQSNVCVNIIIEYRLKCIEAYKTLYIIALIFPKFWSCYLLFGFPIITLCVLFNFLISSVRTVIKIFCILQNKRHCRSNTDGFYFSNFFFFFQY